jgi:hypothetical protein
VRLCLGAERIRAGWIQRTGRHTWPTSTAELGPPVRGRAASARDGIDWALFKQHLRLTSGPGHFIDL